MKATGIEYLTTAKLADKLNLQSKELKERLTQFGFIDKESGDLTELGKREGGKIWSNPDRREYIVWPVNIFHNNDGVIEKEIKKFSYLDDNEILSEVSEGEKYIAEYFDAIGIEYRPQLRIEGLSDNYASYRIADFYLPKYKVMVEFAGRWNISGEERVRYQRKKQVYIENKIPCVWLYPDNLGVLHYLFHKRLEDILGNPGLEKELFRYRLTQFWKKDGSNFIGLVLGIIFLFYVSKPWSSKTELAWISLVVIVYNLYRIIPDINLIINGKSINISRLNRWED